MLISEFENHKVILAIFLIFMVAFFYFQGEASGSWHSLIQERTSFRPV